MRVGLLDIAALGALAAALLMPAPARDIQPLFSSDTSLAPAIAEAQADAQRNPEDGHAVARLADLLVRARQTDWAMRVAVAGTADASPGRWRAMVAASTTAMERADLPLSYAWAERALGACQEGSSDCLDNERGRLEIYVKALGAVVASGIDPVKNPKGFEDVVRKAVPLIRVGKPK